jgi:hypothetical protein
MTSKKRTITEKVVAENETVMEYVMKHYCPKNHCGICGNTGVIDSRGITTPAGYEVGGLFWCLCPNGQACRKAYKGVEPTETLFKHFTQHTRRKSESLEKEVIAVIETIPNAVRVREGGGPENLAASLAVSVAKLIRNQKV